MYEFIKIQTQFHTVSLLCEVMRVSTSAYYAYLNKHLKKEIKLIHKTSCKCYGKRRIQAELHSQGKYHGLQRISHIMNSLNIRTKVTKKHRVTTLSKHDLVVYENVLDRNFSPNKPGESFDSDITYIRTSSGWLYLAVTIDLYSRKVVGWSMATICVLS